MAKRSVDGLSLGTSEPHSYAPQRPSMLPTPDPETPATSQRKMAHLEQQTSVSEVMKCTLPPHRAAYTFSNYEDYEVHYKQFHVNRCSECGKNFPSERFLNLHIEENHDPLMEVKKARGEKTYGCFVEDCERRCSTPRKRRLHLIDKHMFPRKYNFFIVNDGIDRHMSMLNRGSSSTKARRVSLAAPTLSPQHSHRRRLYTATNKETGPHDGTQDIPMDLTGPQPSGGNSVSSNMASSSLEDPRRTTDDMADLAKSMSALKFVPKSVSLRQQKAKKDLKMHGT